MIASGQKREEYREMKPYWHKRFTGKRFDAVRFTNGYSKGARTMLVGLAGIDSGLGILEWGAPAGEAVYILRLAEIIEAPR